jgi:hypothetical protein
MGQGQLSNIVVLSVLVAMAATTSISVITSYYFYRWRRSLTFEGKVVTVPEELIARLALFSDQLKATQSAIGSNAVNQKQQGNHLLQSIGKTKTAVQQLFETTVSLQGALDQRDAEIDRLKRGTIPN